MDHSRFRLPRFKSLKKRDYVMAIVSGALLAAAFPKPELSLLAWFAFVPLLLATGRKSAGKAFRLGFVAGITAYGGILYWLNIVMTTYGKLPPVVSFLLFMLLAAYMALYVALLMFLVRKGEEKGIPLFFTFPVFWVALEYIRSFLLTGFPWANLADSQYNILPLIQVVDITGIYGLSFLIALANVVVYQLVEAIFKRGRRMRAAVGTAFFLALLTVTVIYGFNRLERVDTGVPVKIALVQGNIDQSVKWDPAYQETTVAIYERLTRQAGTSGADLVVWPESAAPFYFQDQEKYASRIKSLAAAVNAHMVVGSPAYDIEDGGIKYRNSAFLVSPGGDVAGRSDKIHLVPFGEYVPLKKLLPFVDKLVVGVGDFSPGAGTVPLPINKGKIGILVCFEGIFPELSRGYVQAGSRLLVNITNDAWYGRSSAPYQHLSMTVFRAVENRVPLVRAANTGISALIDSKGRITGRSALFEEAVIAGEIRLGDGDTLYNRYGDLFARVCLSLAAVFAIAVFVRKNKRKEE